MLNFKKSIIVLALSILVAPFAVAQSAVKNGDVYEVRDVTHSYTPGGLIALESPFFERFSRTFFLPENIFYPILGDVKKIDYQAINMNSVLNGFTKADNRYADSRKNYTPPKRNKVKSLRVLFSGDVGDVRYAFVKVGSSPEYLFIDFPLRSLNSSSRLTGEATKLATREFIKDRTANNFRVVPDEIAKRLEVSGFNLSSLSSDFDKDTLNLYKSLFVPVSQRTILKPVAVNYFKGDSIHKAEMYRILNRKHQFYFSNQARPKDLEVDATMNSVFLDLFKPLSEDDFIKRHSRSDLDVLVDRYYFNEKNRETYVSEYKTKVFPDSTLSLLNFSNSDKKVIIPSKWLSESDFKSYLPELIETAVAVTDSKNIDNNISETNNRTYIGSKDLSSELSLGNINSSVVNDFHDKSLNLKESFILADKKGVSVPPEDVIELFVDTGGLVRKFYLYKVNKDMLAKGKPNGYLLQEVSMFNGLFNKKVSMNFVKSSKLFPSDFVDSLKNMSSEKFLILKSFAQSPKFIQNEKVINPVTLNKDRVQIDLSKDEIKFTVTIISSIVTTKKDWTENVEISYKLGNRYYNLEKENINVTDEYGLNRKLDSFYKKGGEAEISLGDFLISDEVPEKDFKVKIF